MLCAFLLWRTQEDCTVLSPNIISHLSTFSLLSLPQFWFLILTVWIAAVRCQLFLYNLPMRTFSYLPSLTAFSSPPTHLHSSHEQTCPRSWLKCIWKPSPLPSNHLLIQADPSMLLYVNIAHSVSNGKGRGEPDMIWYRRGNLYCIKWYFVKNVKQHKMLKCWKLPGYLKSLAFSVLNVYSFWLS